MKFYLSTLVLFLALSALSAETPQDPQKPADSVRFIICWKLTQGEPESHPSFKVCEEVLADEPAWNPTVAQAPPLTLGSALEITREEIPRYDQAELAWSAREIILREVRPNRWVYLVRWEAYDSQGTGEHSLLIPVLMSGQTVEGKMPTTEGDRAR